MESPIDQPLYRERIVGLNSLRTLAFLAIFFFHTIPEFTYGYLGVDLFFVLSSFLLTYLALEEMQRSGSFSHSNFFMRRVLRIFPLYFLIVALGLVVVPWVARAKGIEVTLPEQPWKYWTFLSNFEQSDHLFALKFLWSIAVEEQFYLLFMLCALMFQRYIGVFIAALLLVHLIFTGWAAEAASAVYQHTLTHFADFAVGAGTGWMFFQGRRGGWVIGLAALVLIMAFVFLPLPELVAHITISVGFGLLILLVATRAVHAANHPVLRFTEWMGTYTYGLYVYSGFVITFGQQALGLQNDPLGITIELIILLIVAVASYHLFERPFLRLKRRFRKV